MRYTIPYIKYAIGIVYLIFRFLVYSTLMIFFFVILVLWYFNFKFLSQFIKNIKEEWSYFYKHETGKYCSIEVYRYNTLKDFVNNKKTYSTDRSMDFEIIDISGNTISYVVNAPDESTAQNLAYKKVENYFNVHQIPSLEIPAMFKCCIMDRKTIDGIKNISV